MKSKQLKRKREKKQEVENELMECCSENIDINRLYMMVETGEKLTPNRVYPVNDVKRMREAQEKNILSEIRANNLEK